MKWEQFLPALLIAVSCSDNKTHTDISLPQKVTLSPISTLETLIESNYPYTTLDETKQILSDIFRNIYAQLSDQKKVTEERIKGVQEVAKTADGNEPQLAFVGALQTGIDPMFYITDVRGKNTKRILPKIKINGQSALLQYPVWAPHNNQIGFIAFFNNMACEVPGAESIYSVYPDGSGLQRLTDKYYDYIFSFDWSPDGANIIFSSNSGIYGLDVKKQKVHQVLPGASIYSSGGKLPILTEVQWSPKGDLVAFISRKDGQKYLMVMNPDGTGQKNITPRPRNDVVQQIRWSPDGRMLAFIRGKQYLNNIYIIESNGNNLRPVTHSTSTKSMDNVSWEAPPSWSSDGNYIVAQFSNGNRIEKVNIADGIRELIGEGRAPSWSSDGRYIAYESYTKKGTALTIFDVNEDRSWYIPKSFPDQLLIWDHSAAAAWSNK